MAIGINRKADHIEFGPFSTVSVKPVRIGIDLKQRITHKLHIRKNIGRAPSRRRRLLVGNAASSYSTSILSSFGTLEASCAVRRLAGSEKKG